MTTQQINCYPVDKYQGNQLRYPVDRKIHLFNNWDQGWSLLEAKVSSLPVNCSFFAQQESVWLKCLCYCLALGPIQFLPSSEKNRTSNHLRMLGKVEELLSYL